VGLAGKKKTSEKPKGIRGDSGLTSKKGLQKKKNINSRRGEFKAAERATQTLGDSTDCLVATEGKGS